MKSVICSQNLDWDPMQPSNISNSTKAKMKASWETVNDFPPFSPRDPMNFGILYLLGKSEGVRKEKKM